MRERRRDREVDEAGELLQRAELGEDRHRLLGADERDRDDRRAGAHRRLDEAAAAEAAQAVAVLVELLGALAALGEDEHELLLVVQQAVHVGRVRGDAADLGDQHAEAGIALEEVLDGQVQRPRLRVLFLDRLGDHRRVGRQRAGVVGDQQRAALGRDVLDALDLAAEPQVVVEVDERLVEEALDALRAAPVGDLALGLDRRRYSRRSGSRSATSRPAPGPGGPRHRPAPAGRRHRSACSRGLPGAACCVSCRPSRPGLSQAGAFRAMDLLLNRARPTRARAAARACAPARPSRGRRRRPRSRRHRRSTGGGSSRPRCPRSSAVSMLCGLSSIRRSIADLDAAGDLVLRAVELVEAQADVVQPRGGRGVGALGAVGGDVDEVAGVGPGVDGLDGARVGPAGEDRRVAVGLIDAAASAARA